MSNDPHMDDTIRQAYRAAAQTEPDPQLDARILQAAHAALATPVRKPVRWSWLMLPFSAAAVAILVTTIVLQLRQTPSTPSQESASAPATQAAKPEVAAAPAAQPPDLKIASAKPEKKAERHAQAAPASRAVRQDQAAQNAAAGAALQDRRRSEREQLAAAEAQAKQKPDLKIAAAPPLTRGAESAPKPAPSVAQPSADADSTAVGAAVSGASEAARPSAAHAPPAPAPAAQRAEPSADRLAETQPAIASKPEALDTLAKARSPGKPTDKQLEDIRRLQREGKLEAAKKALAELRKQFPLYKVPEDLRGLIEPGVEPAAEGNK
jgi:hypothetical protein